MTETATRVSKSSVRAQVREIRRTADSIANLVEVLNEVAKKDGVTIPEAIEARPITHAALAEALNVIDGTSAQLREALGFGVQF